MLFRSSQSNSIKGKNELEGDGVYGVLTVVRQTKLRRITREELEEEIGNWREIYGPPPETPRRDEVTPQVGPEFSFTDLSGADLSGMDLRMTKITNCDLHGAKLNSTVLDGAFLFGCDLSQIESWVGSFRCTSFRQCYIVTSRFMHGRFEGAIFAHANLENTKLINSYHDRDTWFFKARLHGTDFQEAHLEKVNLKEARTLFGVKLHMARLEGTEIDYDLFGGKIGEELEHQFVKAAQTYAAIKANLESAGRYDQAARAYVKERQMEKAASAPWNARSSYGVAELGDEYEYSQEEGRPLRVKVGAKWWNVRTWKFYLRHVVKWMSDWIVDVLCCYGESVWRVLFSMAATLFVFGPILIRLLGGLKWSSENQQAYDTFSNSVQRWGYEYFQYVLYMLDTFTTANFAKLEPANDLVRLASGFLALVGIFLAGLLGFVAGNRIRHS